MTTKINDSEKQKEKTEKRLNIRDQQPGWLIYLLSLVGLLYLLNPTAGLIEIIPDNFPLVGNLDEGVAAVLVWEGINQVRNARINKREKPSR